MIIVVWMRKKSKLVELFYVSSGGEVLTLMEDLERFLNEKTERKGDKMENEMTTTNTPVKGTGVTSKEPFDWSKSLVLAKLCELAYSEFNTADKKLEDLGFTCLEKFDDIRVGTQAMLIRKGEMLVLSFRGTETKGEGFQQDVITDLSVGAKEHRGVDFHKGFLEGYISIGWDIKQSLDEHLKKGDLFYITGHSLGGALATIANFCLPYSKRVVTACYTFGAPPVATKILILLLSSYI